MKLCSVRKSKTGKGESECESEQKNGKDQSWGDNSLKALRSFRGQQKLTGAATELKISVIDLSHSALVTACSGIWESLSLLHIITGHICYYFYPCCNLRFSRYMFGIAHKLSYTKVSSHSSRLTKKQSLD